MLKKIIILLIISLLNVSYANQEFENAERVFNQKFSNKITTNSSFLDSYIERNNYLNKPINLKKDSLITKNIFDIKQKDRVFYSDFNKIQEDFYIIRNLNLTGKGIHIAVIDSGISDYDNNLNIKNLVSCTYGYDSEKGFYRFPSSTKDYYGHGSKLSTLINHKITGIAPKSFLSVIDFKDLEEDKKTSIVSALNCSVKYKPDIISISQSGWFSNDFILNKENNTKNVQETIKVYENIVKNDILLIGVSDYKYLNDVQRLMDSIIEDKNRKNIFDVKGLKDQTIIAQSDIGYVLIGENEDLIDRTVTVNSEVWYSYCGKEIDNKNICLSPAGDSIAPPIVASLAALMKEANPKLTFKEISDIILKTANRNDENYKNNTCGKNKNKNCGEFYYGKGFLNPVLAVQMAKQKNN